MVGNKEWIDLLTEGKDNKVKEFNEVKERAESEILAIMEYRRLEKERGRGVELKPTNDIDTLERIFLEPISQGAMDELHNKFKALKMSMAEGYDKLYKMYKQDPNSRFIYFISIIDLV